MLCCYRAALAALHGFSAEAGFAKKDAYFSLNIQKHRCCVLQPVFVRHGVAFASKARDTACAKATLRWHHHHTAPLPVTPTADGLQRFVCLMRMKMIAAVPPCPANSQNAWRATFTSPPTPSRICTAVYTDHHQQNATIRHNAKRHAPAVSAKCTARQNPPAPPTNTTLPADATMQKIKVIKVMQNGMKMVCNVDVM